MPAIPPRVAGIGVFRPLRPVCRGNSTLWATTGRNAGSSGALPDAHRAVCPPTCGHGPVACRSPASPPAR